MNQQQTTADQLEASDVERQNKERIALSHQMTMDAYKLKCAFTKDVLALGVKKDGSASIAASAEGWPVMGGQPSLTDMGRTDDHGPGEHRL